MKRSLARVEEPTPHEADENVPRIARTLEVVTLTKPYHGLVGVTRARVRMGSATLDVDGFGVAHALRRAALAIEAAEAAGDLEVTEPRRLALRALVHAADEIWRLALLARETWRAANPADPVTGLPWWPPGMSPQNEVIAELGAAMTALRTDLALEED